MPPTWGVYFMVLFINQHHGFNHLLRNHCIVGRLHVGPRLDGQTASTDKQPTTSPPLGGFIGVCSL